MMSNLVKNTKFLNALRALRVSKRFGSTHGHHKTRLEVAREYLTTMDHLPQPKGPWKDLDNKRQAVNNATLAFGAGLFLVSLVVTKSLWDDVLLYPPYDKVSKDFPGAKFSDAK